MGVEIAPRAKEVTPFFSDTHVGRLVGDKSETQSLLPPLFSAKTNSVFFVPRDEAQEIRTDFDLRATS